MVFVADASIAAAWLLPDEDAVLADLALDRLASDTALVPDLFWHELRNLLLSAERRGRIDEYHANASIACVRQLRVHSPRPPRDDHVLAWARRHRITAYDASYLGLAIQEDCPLASLDRRLTDAAAAEGLPPFA